MCVMISLPQIRRPIYYGWPVLAAISAIGFANAVTSMGVLTVFVLPMSDEFGWSRAQISGATSAGALLGALAAPLSGRISDKVGARPILVLGGIVITISMGWLSAIQGLLGFYLAFGLARLSDQGFIQAVSPPAIAQWFDEHRGKALAALFFSTSAGGIVLPLVTQFIISGWGWRPAWGTLAAIMAVLGLAPVALIVRRPPVNSGAIDERATTSQRLESGELTELTETPSDDQSRSISDALLNRDYWLILGAMFGTGIASTGVALHMVPFLVQEGVAETAAVGAVSVSFLVGAIASLGWGMLSERVSARLLLAGVFLVRGASVALLLVSDTLIEAFAFAVLRGIAEGGLGPVSAILLARYFGRGSLGTIYGLTRAVLVMGFAFGPVLAGAVYDGTDSYTATFIGFFATAMVSVAMVMLTKRPAKDRGDR